MSPTGARQLALELPHQESFARDDFLQSRCNADALATIERWPDWPAPALALVGPSGSGKSHLAAIWAELAGARFLSGKALRTADLPAALATGALVLEDVGTDGLDERALFHLLNLVREHEAFLLLTTAAPPASWSVGLPDLGSRLRALPVATVQAPDDGLLRAALVKQFADRQLNVDGNLIEYLLARIERSLAGARAAVARLDGEALRLRRPVNRTLAAELFRSGE
ncbi:MAG TPA: chromosomal replication initiator DnaA [Xanthobacteraceae bacterium]